MYVCLRITGIKNYEVLGKLIEKLSTVMLFSIVKVNKTNNSICLYIIVVGYEFTKNNYTKFIKLLNELGLQFSYSSYLDS